jgi:hypothetical protein
MADSEKDNALIGNNILLMPGSELLGVLPEKDTWPPGTCWFCGKRPANEGAQLERFPFKEKKRTFYGSKWVVEGEQLMIKVPRCSQCKSVHRFRKLTPYLSFPVLFIVWFGPVLLMNHFSIRLTEKFIFEPLFFGVLGFAAYILTWIVLIPKIFTPQAKETKDEAKWFSEFPGVDEVRKAGFITNI